MVLPLGKLGGCLECIAKVPKWVQKLPKRVTKMGKEEVIKDKNGDNLYNFLF